MANNSGYQVVGLDDLSPIFETLRQAEQWALTHFDYEQGTLVVSIVDVSNNTVRKLSIRDMEILLYLSEDMEALYSSQCDTDVT